MKTSTRQTLDDAILYPDDDGEPMSDNTIQFRWIVLIKTGLELLFRDRPDVFVAGNLLWYAQEGAPEVRTAPDVLVVFGRPKGERGSYMQWREEGVPPTVVFEIRSPGNRDPEMDRKLRFYNDHGVEEYYFFDPDAQTLQGWLRRDDGLDEIADIQGWVSPRLGIRFELGRGPEGLTIRRPDGKAFQTALEMDDDNLAARRSADDQRRRARAERRRAQAAERQAQAERLDRAAAEQRAEAERQRAERLAARLRELGESVD